MRIHLLRFIILGTTALTACSSDQIIMESVTLSDLENTGCETTYSAKESRPEFYAKEKRKSPKMTISVGGNGVATFHLTNLEYDYITEKIDARLDPQGNTIKIVIAPYKKDPTLEADCYCRYNVGFKLSNLTSGTYHLKVYFADYYGKYEILSPTYDGMIAFKPNETLEFDL